MEEKRKKEEKKRMGYPSIGHSFRYLTLSEEANLSPADLDVYYDKLQTCVLNRKLTNTTRGALSIAPKLKGITNKIAAWLTKVFCRSDVELIVDGYENIPSGAVLFAHTHQGILDNIAWIPGMPRHCLVLHGADVRKSLILAQMNTGLILVSKAEDKEENRKNAKLDMIKVLLKGHSIMYYPEGTWNLSPNKLHLPMRFGFLDIAKKAGVPVVPVVSEFTYDTSEDRERITKVHIRFGKVVMVGRQDNLKDKLVEYQECISTIRWELIEEKGLYQRSTVSYQEYVNYLKGNIRNLKMGKIDLNRERAGIYGFEDDFYRFHPINDLPLDVKEISFQ